MPKKLEATVPCPPERSESGEHGAEVVSQRQVAPSMGRGKKAAFLLAAGCFFTLAAIGVVLPGLPTTPFLLCSSYFLVRCSPRLNQRLLRSRVFGPMLLDWQVHRAVRRQVKAKAILAVAITVVITIWLTNHAWWAATAIALLALTGVAIVARLPTLENEVRNDEAGVLTKDIS